MADHNFDIKTLLGNFRDSVEAGDVSFLKGEKCKAHRETVLAAADMLKTEVEKVDEQKENARGYTGSSGPHPPVDSYEMHREGVALWQALISAALLHIDPRTKGNSKLHEYLDDATKFEDLLYGLEEYYRDHTLHSLWVYLIGLDVMGDETRLKPVADDLNWYVYNDVTAEEHIDIMAKWGSLTEHFLNCKINEKQDAIWCIMALCHDLGYSITKLSKLNESVQNVLKHYDVSSISRVGYSLDIEHQYLVEQFLELMAMDVRIVPGGDDPRGLEKETLDTPNGVALSWIDHWIADASMKSVKNKMYFKDDKSLYKRLTKAIKEELGATDPARSADSIEPSATTAKDWAKSLNISVLTKCYRDDSLYWRLCKALESKEHGVMSAYLLFKKMGIFADTYIRGSGEEWGLEDSEAIRNIICGDILFAIAQHEFAFAYVSSMGSLADILILCDELEEFSRYGRELLTHKYHDTTAETSVTIDGLQDNGSADQPPLGDRWMTISMKYVSERHDDGEFCGFCYRKARRMCELFSLESRKERDEDKQQDQSKYPIEKIEATFIREKDKKSKAIEIVFTMTNDGKQTMRTKWDDKKQEFSVECRDDELHVQAEKEKQPENGAEVTSKYEDKKLDDKTDTLLHIVQRKLLVKPVGDGE